MKDKPQHEPVPIQEAPAPKKPKKKITVNDLPDFREGIRLHELEIPEGLNE